MAKVSTVKEIEEADGDTIIQCFKGRIVWISKFFDASRSQKKEAQNFQVIQLEELREPKARVRAILRNRDEVPKNWLHQSVSLTANHSSRGWTGLLAKDYESKDKDGNMKIERVLWVTATCALVKDMDAGGSEPERSEGSPNRGTQSSGATTRQNQSEAAGGLNAEETAAVMDMMKQTTRCVNASMIIFRAIEKGLVDKGVNLTNEMFQALHATYFIRCDKIGCIGNLPLKDLTGFFEYRDQKVAQRGDQAEADRKAKEEEEARRRKEEEEAAAAKQKESGGDEWGDDELPM